MKLSYLEIIAKLKGCYNLAVSTINNEYDPRILDNRRYVRNYKII